jgi:hypothetical protein
MEALSELIGTPVLDRHARDLISPLPDSELWFSSAESRGVSRFFRKLYCLAVIFTVRIREMTDAAVQDLLQFRPARSEFGALRFGPQS